MREVVDVSLLSHLRRALHAKPADSIGIVVLVKQLTDVTYFCRASKAAAFSLLLGRDAMDLGKM